MSLNRVQLIGYVGKDPEVKVLDGGGKVANFNIATTDRGYTAKDGTVIPDRTEWHRVVVWRQLAEVVEKYVAKGQLLFVEGKLKTRSYDQGGQTKYVTEIFVENLEMLGGRKDGEAPRSAADAPRYSAPSPAPRPAAVSDDPFASPGPVGDDLPF